MPFEGDVTRHHCRHIFACALHVHIVSAFVSTCPGHVADEDDPRVTVGTCVSTPIPPRALFIFATVPEVVVDSDIMSESRSYHKQHHTSSWLRYTYPTRVTHSRACYANVWNTTTPTITSVVPSPIRTTRSFVWTHLPFRRFALLFFS